MFNTPPPTPTDNGLIAEIYKRKYTCFRLNAHVDSTQLPIKGIILSLDGGMQLCG